MIDSYKGEYFNLFKSIFDDAKNGICIVDYNGKFVELNNLYAEMFGYEKNELIGKDYTTIITDDSIPVVEKNHKKVFNGTSILKADEKVKHKNGTFFYVQTTNLRINDEQGNRLRITTAIDITSRLRNELIQSVLLKISNLTNLTVPSDDLYASIHNSLCELLPIKNFAVCVKSTITNQFAFPYVVNEKAKDKNETLEAEHNLVSQSKRTVVLDADKINALLENEELKPYEIIPKSILGIPLASQSEILGSLLIRSYDEVNFSNEEKEILELVAGQIAHVIERKNYEDKLVYARMKAEEAVKIKSEFLAQISHEIRTPLNSILSFSSLIKKELNGQLTPELNETFKYIESGGNRLTRTIDLILNVSKSQNNQYKIKLEEVELEDDVLRPIVEGFKNVANKKGIDIDIEKNENQFKIVCDLYSVNQLFSNLIENAVKYTNQGRITIRTFLNEMGKIQVDIEDTGIGISSEYIPKLFEPFSQEEQGYTRSYEGIGLGLSLVKNYADLNNAEIKVKSEKEKGSVFSVIFN